MVHVHPHGVRWESIDNRVLTISAAADMAQQGPQDSPVASSTSVSVLAASKGAEQVGSLTAMEVVCALDHSAPLEIGINVDPQADTTEPVSPNSDTTANGSSTSQLESLEGSSEDRPDGTSSKTDNAPPGVSPAADSSSSLLSIPKGLSEGLLHKDDPEQLSKPASMQAAESQQPDADLDQASTSLPENLATLASQQAAVSDQVCFSSGRDLGHDQVLTVTSCLNCLAYARSGSWAWQGVKQLALLDIAIIVELACTILNMLQANMLRDAVKFHVSNFTHGRAEIHSILLQYLSPEEMNL